MITYSRLDRKLHQGVDELKALITRRTAELAATYVLKSPFPVEFAQGRYERREDIVAICRIVWWNDQWKSEDNHTSKPITEMSCMKNLPRSQTAVERNKFRYFFRLESGTLLKDKPSNGDGVKTPKPHQIDAHQLCQTPACVIPDYDYDGKRLTCQYCTGIACNCFNCVHLRAFFRIRTALITKREVNTWDTNDINMLRKIRSERSEIKRQQQILNLSKVLYGAYVTNLPGVSESAILSNQSQVQKTIDMLAERLIDGPPEYCGLDCAKEIFKCGDEMFTDMLELVKNKRMQNKYGKQIRKLIKTTSGKAVSTKPREGSNVVSYFEMPNYAQHMFRLLLINSTITRLTCFPASRLNSPNAFDISDILSSCIRKGSAGWKSNAPRLIRPVPSSNLLQICNTELSCNHSKHEKEDDEFVKTKS